MPPRTVWLHRLRWPEVEAHLEDDDVALVPVGATEQHGRHLPLLVDTGWAEAACELAARRENAIVAPAVPYGWSPHHMGYPGTVTLGAATLQAVVEDIGRSLIHHGFRCLIVVNGNRIANLGPLEIAAVRLTNRAGAYVAVADAGLIAREEVKALCDLSGDGLDHAGEAESAFALHWAGRHVAMDEAGRAIASSEDGPASSSFVHPVELDPALGGNAASRFATPDEHRRRTAPDGSIGDPTSASAEKGRAMIEAVAANLARLIAEARAADVGEVRADIPV